MISITKINALSLDANNIVQFSAIGDDELIRAQGTTHGSQKVELCNGVAKIKVKHLGRDYALAVMSNGITTVVQQGLK